jgi:hypothetical protein
LMRGSDDVRHLIEGFPEESDFVRAGDLYPA